MDKKSGVPSWLRGTIFWGFGVGTCAFYAVSTLQVCAQENGMLSLFWPLLVIPIANAAALLYAKEGTSSRTLGVLSALNGVACAVSILLTIVLSPLCVLACIGICVLFFVWPVLPFCLYHLLVALGPIITSFAMRRRLLRLKKEQHVPWLPMGTAAALTLATALMAVFPSLLTQRCLDSAGNEQMRKQSILLLRAFGDNETMLRSCYSKHLILPWYFQMIQGLSSDYSDAAELQRQAARENFYRATGLPFNSMKRPPGSDYYCDWDDEIEWWDDHDFAGATVGGIVRGLTLTKSNIDGWVDSDEAVSHLSWSMHIKHDSSSRAELRAELMLPPQAVVSGCSLWVDGVRNDAIIGTRTSTRQAYQASANNGDRPFLVSTAGPGRVLIQSSTGWWGKDVDLTVDITAPLTILQKDSAALRLPVFAERNFGVTAKHTVKLVAITSGASRAVNAELSDPSIHGAEGTIYLKRNPNVVRVTASAPYLQEGSELVEELKSSNCDRKIPLLVVLDGSSSMSPYIDSVCKALSGMDLPDSTLVWASDTPQVLIRHADSTQFAWKNTVTRLHDAGCVGGQDNAQALLLAIDEMKNAESANIVWIHGPQPAKLSGDKLPKALSGSKCRLFEYQVTAAPNDLIRSLDLSSNLVQVANLKDTETDLKDLFGKLSGAQPVVAMAGSIETSTDQAPSAKHPNELAQVFVNQLISSKLGEQDKKEELGIMAQKASIVTPLTSAIVMERKSDYERYDVKQYGKSNTNANKNSANKDSNANPLGFASPLIPNTPEPPMWMLVACASLILAGLTWIKRRFKHA